MTDIHLSRDLLYAMLEGRLPERYVPALVFEHLLALCPTCRREWRAFHREWIDRERRRPPSPEQLLHAARALLAAHEEGHAGDAERRARRDLAELKRLAPGDREGRITRARRRFTGLRLAELLLEESRGALPGDPEASLGWARLAHLVTWRVDAGHGQRAGDLRVYALALAGNGYRATYHHRRARQVLTEARSLLRSHGVTDTVISAHLDRYEGTYYRDIREFQTAERLLTRAALGYGLHHETREQIATLLMLATTYAYRDDLPRAISTTTQALQHLHDPADPLYLCARFNLAHYLVEDRRYHEAELVLDEDREHHARALCGWKHLDLRLAWLRGRIARGLGEVAAAHRLLETARQGFAAARIGYDAALVSLDLAQLFLDTGDAGALKELAREIYPICAAEDLHQEATAALLLLVHAIERQRLTGRFVTRLARYLLLAQHDPSYRFQP